MTREDTIKLLMVIQATFPNFKVEDKTTTVDAWLMLLEEYDVNDVYLAFKSYCKSNNSGFAPSVSQIISELEKVGDLAQMDDATALAKFRKALSRSTYHSQEEFDKLEPTLQKAIGSADMLHFWATDENNKVSVIESNFLNNYRQVCKRQKEYRKMPKELQARVEQFIEQVPKLDNNTLLIGTAAPIQEVEPVTDGNYSERVKARLEME